VHDFAFIYVKKLLPFLDCEARLHKSVSELLISSADVIWKYQCSKLTGSQLTVS